MSWGLHEKCGIWDQNALLCIEQEHLAAQTPALSHCWAVASLYLQLRLWFYESKLLAAKLVSTCICVLPLAHLDPSAQLLLYCARSIICGTLLWTVSGNLANLKNKHLVLAVIFLSRAVVWLSSQHSLHRERKHVSIHSWHCCQLINQNHCCFIVKPPCKEFSYFPCSFHLTSPGTLLNDNVCLF